MTDQSVSVQEAPVLGKMDKRVAIMRAAERQFHNRRFHEVTLDEVAESAGVGKGTIYRYFVDKDDLFYQMATAGFDELCERVAHCAEEPGCPMRTRLLNIVRAMCDYFDERIEMYTIINAETAWMPDGPGGVRERWQELRTRLPNIVGGVFVEGMKNGEVRAGMLPEVLAYYFVGMTRTLVRDLRRITSMQEVELKEHQETIVDLFLSGAAPHADVKES